MVLVAYSDSEGSDADPGPTPTEKVAPATTITQANASDAADRLHPKKIKVSLQIAEEEHKTNGEGQPAPKRARTTGAFSGFNSMLPAPKRESQPRNGEVGGKHQPRKVSSLKTGAEPGFNRDSDAEMRQLFAEQDASSGGADRTFVNPSKEDSLFAPNSTSVSLPHTSGTSQVGNPLRFKPLSVARKPPKKRKLTTASSESSLEVRGPQQTARQELAPPAKAKINLFSVMTEQHVETSVAPEATYDSMIYGASPDEDEQDVPEAPENDSKISDVVKTHSYASNPQPGPQSLDTIASDLNLSASARRQLLGRNGKGGNVINVVNFNTDEEYAANEALRQSGEIVQHNAVRAIAPGKHSLKQLVNAASTQKDALEESFAAGRRNKAEAGSRYAW